MESFLGVKVLLFIAIAYVSIANGGPSGKVKELYSWNPFTFADLPHNEFSQVDGYNYYISKFNLPTAVSYHDKSGCMFLPILRLNPGIPATITYFNTNDYRKGSSPALRGFPTYEDNYIPGWFGVNTLPDDDYLYNTYPGYSRTLDITDEEEEKQDKEEPKVEDLKKDEVKQENQDQVEEKKDKEEDVKEADKPIDEKKSKEVGDEETRKNHGNYNKGPSVVYVPVPVSSSSPTTTSSRNLYHFVSIYYTNMDNQCDRIFFVDYGVQRQFGQTLYTRRPVLWAFPVNECNQQSLDQAPVLKVTIPNTVYSEPTGFSATSVDIYGNCNEFAVYIPNCYDNTLIVYDNVKKSFWVYKHDTFQPGAERSLVSGYLPPIDSYNFGILGISLGAATLNSYRELFYAPGSSFGLFKTSTEIVRNKYWAPGDPKSPYFSFLGYGGIDRQSFMAYDSDTQVLFFVHFLSNTLQCWNTNTPLVEDNVVVLFGDLEFGVDLLIDGERNLRFLLYSGEGLTVYDQGRNSNPFYQLYRVSIDGVIKGTACDPKKGYY